MRKSFIERVKKELCVDTKKYRYILKGNTIYRIDQLQVDTTASLHFDDEFCQNGWKTVYKLKPEEMHYYSLQERYYYGHTYYEIYDFTDRITLLITSDYSKALKKIKELRGIIK